MATQRNTARYKRLIEIIDQSNATHIELIEMACEHLETYWDCVKTIKKDGLLIATENGSQKVHPAIQIKNSASKEIVNILKVLGVKQVKPEEITEPDIEESL